MYLLQKISRCVDSQGPGNNIQDNIMRHLKLFLFASNGLSEQDDYSAKLLPLAVIRRDPGVFVSITCRASNLFCSILWSASKEYEPF